MIITYENLLTPSEFRLQPCQQLKNLNIFNFLSFQDALHYLIKIYHLQDKKILVPAFYCDATINDMKKHGLHVSLCQIDHEKFDVNVSDFTSKLQLERPDIIIIYNFFGKNSLLYHDLDWRKHLKTKTVIISDFAHSLIPNHSITFLNERHFYIDSTRKNTCRMMAHLITPKEMTLNTEWVVVYSFFKFYIRTLFLVKSWCLRFATLLNIKFLSDLGTRLYDLHDRYIGSPGCAFTGFWWDSFLYSHINFEKIKNHRRFLYHEYKNILINLAAQGYIEIIELPSKEEENLCFFFIRFTQYEKMSPALKLLQDNGFWVDTLWNFNEIKEITPNDRDWAKSIAVLPYTMRVKQQHIHSITSLLEKFFNATMDIV
jgi:hypothetical protein